MASSLIGRKSVLEISKLLTMTLQSAQALEIRLSQHTSTAAETATLR
jgi:hypothetical protein